MLRYALVLFDDDGCTSIVETRKLQFNEPLAQSVICTLGMAHGPAYVVEILKLSDQKKELNSYEKVWSQTQRSMALDTAKMSNVTGGYLKIWPNDQGLVENSEARCVSEADSVGKENRTETRDVNDQRLRRRNCRDKEENENAETNEEKEFHDVCDDDNLIPKRKRRRVNNKPTEEQEQAQISIPLPTVTDQSGSTDMNEVDVEEIRTTVMVQEYERNKRNFSTQTDPVVVLGSNTNFTGLHRENRCKCKCEDSLTLMKQTNEKIDKLFEAINVLSENLEKNKNDVSLMSLSTLESLVNVPVSMTYQQPSSDITDVVALPEEQSSSSHEVVSVVHLTEDQQSDKENDPQLTATPLYIPNIIGSPIISEKVYSKPCLNGQIVEIKSILDIPTFDCELRIHQDIQWQVKEASCSVGNYAWQLTKIFYRKEELVGRNYKGRKGKLRLSPRRVHAIEHATYDMYGACDVMKSLPEAINTGIRNIDRVPLSKLTKHSI